MDSNAINVNNFYSSHYISLAVIRESVHPQQWNRVNVCHFFVCEKKISFNGFLLAELEKANNRVDCNVDDELSTFFISNFCPYFSFHFSHSNSNIPHDILYNIFKFFYYIPVAYLVIQFWRRSIVMHTQKVIPSDHTWIEHI